MGNYTRKGALLLSLVMAMSSVSIAATAVDVTAEDEAAAVVATQSADNAVSVQSDDPENINITDDDGYVWNGYYNDDGTITITGTQQLWGNAYTDKGSESSKDALIIPESIGGKTVTGINSYMTTRRFDTGFNDNVIRKIVLPKTVTTIDCYSVWSGTDTGLFGRFSNLEELDLGGASADATDLFGHAGTEVDAIPLKKLTMSSYVSWDSDNERQMAIRKGIETISIREDDYVEIWNYPNLQTLNLLDEYTYLSLSNLPNLTTVNSPSKSIADAYIVQLRDCPKVNITEVTVPVYEVATSEQTKMFANSPVEEVTLDFQNQQYYQISKAIFCGASKLKAIHVKNVYESSYRFCSEDGVLYWKGFDDDITALFAYPAAKNPGGTYVMPENMGYVYAFAFYGSQLSKVYIPESLPGQFDWDRESFGNWYREEDFPELKGQDRLYIGDMSGNITFSAVVGTNGCYWPDSLTYENIPESRQEFRQGSTYALNYNLKGGTNHPDNPTSYVVGSEPIELEPAYRAGYTFDGWKDEDGNWRYETPSKPWKRSDGALHRFKDQTFTAQWKKINKMQIDGSSKTIAAGKKISLDVESSNNWVENSQLKWSTNNKKVATVNADGVVTFAKNAGGKSVTVTAKLRTNSKVKATYKIKCVKYAVTKVTITGKKTTMHEDETQRLTAKVSGKKGAYKALEWSSSNSSRVSVNSKGKVTVNYALDEPYTVTITATAKDGSGKKGTYKIRVVK